MFDWLYSGTLSQIGINGPRNHYFVVVALQNLEIWLKLNIVLFVAFRGFKDYGTKRDSLSKLLFILIPEYDQWVHHSLSNIPIMHLILQETNLFCSR